MPPTLRRPLRASFLLLLLFAALYYFCLMRPRRIVTPISTYYLDREENISSVELESISTVKLDNASTVELDKTNETVDGPLILPFVALTPEQELNPFAYVFYAADDTYACSALINIRILRGLSRLPIYMLVTIFVSESYVKLISSFGVHIIVENPPSLNPQSPGYSTYRYCLLKLLAFKMHHYAPHLQRVVIMDSDALVLGGLDQLFELPHAPLAAPAAYWQKPGDISSTMMLIELSNATWDRVDHAIQNIGFDVYDMDLVNDLFGQDSAEKTDFLQLPGNYASINSLWEAWDLPTWFTGQLEKLHISQEDRLLPSTNDRFIEMFRQSLVIHFYAIGKPWSVTIEQVQTKQPAPHWLLWRQFEIWQHHASSVCLPDEDYTLDEDYTYDDDTYTPKAQSSSSD